jgi:hypothetical protein
MESGGKRTTGAGGLRELLGGEDSLPVNGSRRSVLIVWLGGLNFLYTDY